MIRRASSLASLAVDRAGAMAVEVALSAPIMAMMVFGIFEVGLVVARQHELQSAASEVEGIVLASNLGAETNVNELEQIIMTSVGIPADKVQISRRFRCGVSTELVTSADQCFEDDVVSSYLSIDISDTYQPTWTAYGIGREINYSVQRMVQVS